MHKNMKAIYDTNSSIFSVAVAYLLNKGFSTVQSITDEQIAGIEGNGIMTKEYCQSLVRLAKNIANECGNNVVELIQFCQAEHIFDTDFYTGRNNDYDDDYEDDEPDDNCLTCSDAPESECTGHCCNCMYGAQ